MKDPAFLFYGSDFLSGTMLMSDEQVGKYIRLMCLQQINGHLSKEDMIKICKSYDKDIFSHFEQDDDGLYFNKRLEEEITKRKKYSESRANNRINGNKKGKKLTHKKHINNTSKSYDKHMGNGNGNINININKDNNIGGMGEKEEEKNWRDDFEVYKKQCVEAFARFAKDEEFIKEREAFLPGVDILMTLRKAYTDYWGTEAAWQHKRKSQSENIDWKKTIKNALDQKNNKVYKNGNKFGSNGTNIVGLEGANSGFSDKI